MATLKPYHGRMIALLAQQKMLIADLYKLFSGFYPDNREFWSSLAIEVMEHATWVEYFYRKAVNGEIHFQESQAKTYTIESYIKYLEDTIARVKGKAPLQSAAFSIALGIEQSVLIKKIFDHFLASNTDLANQLNSLRQRSLDVKKKIQDRAAQARASLSSI